MQFEVGDRFTRFGVTHMVIAHSIDIGGARYYCYFDHISHMGFWIFSNQDDAIRRYEE